MIIDGHDVQKKVFVIAEVGNNHEGDFSLAQDMIGKAAASGADAVKFQTIIPELLVSAATDKERVERLKKFQFSYEQFETLAKQAKENNILFFSTPFDLGSASFLNTIQPVFKIASGDNNFYPLIEKVASFHKPLIISTGLSDFTLLDEIYKRVNNVWDKSGVNPGLALLHCVTSYPVPDSEANLASIKSLAKHFPSLTVGYSDHTIGIKASVYAVAAGARIVEKHFTIDKNYSDFRDHQLSADPKDLKEMVSQIREMEQMMGTGERVAQDCEKDMHKSARRSIAAAADIAEGAVLTEADLIWIRPGTGFAPGSESQLIGKKTNRAIAFGEVFQSSDLS